ncbi:MAG: hypothetical protein WD894_10955 [Pirellulales bacterium]
MPTLRWIAVLWPGLPQLWLRGDWSALLLAGGFSALLNLAVIATWGWTELLTWPLLLIAWAGVVLFWLVSLVSAVLQMPALLRVPSRKVAADLFRAAQGEYLRGNWFEAELALNQLLEHDHTDVDAHLMLATLTRRIGQHAEASQRLRLLRTLEGAGKWQLEVARELQLLTSTATVAAQNVQLQETKDHELPNAA